MAAPDMPTTASLSTMTSQVDELLARTLVGARATDRDGTEAVSAALYDAERALRSARRALEAAGRRLG
ncbi:MAG TPA: hypothetical protein VEW93_03335 [Acidimicrobiales bacterium]|nr:hypothetical protein [Acidimicrobiales bacterium]